MNKDTVCKLFTKFSCLKNFFLAIRYTEIIWQLKYCCTLVVADGLAPFCSNTLTTSSVPLLLA